MAILSAEDLFLQFGSKTLFEGATLAVEPRDRLGIVGANGAGKSTLLKILAGSVDPDGGRIVRGRGIRVGYLAQEHSDPGDGALLDYVLASAPGREGIEERLGEVEAGLADTDDVEVQLELSQELADLHGRLVHLDDQFAPHRAQSILAGLGFKQDDLQRGLSELSGGWRMRAALAALLFQQPDVLLLDEPTNHLDMPSVAWLNGYLASFGRALVLTCHDREFLNKHISRVASLELEGLQVFRGNYDEYLVQRDIAMEHLEARIRTDERRKKELEAFVTRFRAKASKARQAQSKAKLIEKLQDAQVDLPQVRRPVSISFAPTERCGNTALVVEKLKFGYTDVPVFDGIDVEVRRGDRIAVVGVNGAGKTTLLKLVCGDLKPQQGEVRLGHNVTPSYFAQHQAEVMSSTNTVLDEVAQAAPALSQTQVRTLCGSFLFSGDDVDKSVGVLSGGEKTRVALACMLAAPGNLLLLDEPTNHLDTESADKLTESLQSYDGTMLFVTHNLDFARRLSNKVWDVHDGRVEVYPGSLKDYLDFIGGVEALQTSDPQPAAESEPNLDKTEPQLEKRAPKLDKKAPKLDKKGRMEARKARAEASKRRSALEKQVSSAEARVAAIEEEQGEVETMLADPSTHPSREYTEALGARYESLRTTLELAMNRWAELQAEFDRLPPIDA